MSSSPPTATSFDRRSLAWAIGRIVLTGVVLLAVYFALPFTHVSLVGTVLGLIAGVAILGGLVVWQVHSITRSTRPQLRALEAVSLSFWVIVVVFSVVYVSLSASAPQSFSEPLNQIDGLYFTMTVFATVGFGDISAVTDASRLLVTLQMLLDLLLLGVVVRVLIGAGKLAAAARGTHS